MAVERDRGRRDELRRRATPTPRLQGLLLGQIDSLKFYRRKTNVTEFDDSIYAAAPLPRSDKPHESLPVGRDEIVRHDDGTPQHCTIRVWKSDVRT
jgi:hypothetical protein